MLCGIIHHTTPLSATAPTRKGFSTGRRLRAGLIRWPLRPWLLLGGLLCAGLAGALHAESDGRTATRLSAAPGTPPTITNQPVSVLVAGASGNSSFSVGASGNPAPTFQWLFNGQPLNGATQSSITLPNNQVTNAGAYAAVAANTAGSVTSSVAIFSFQRLGALPNNQEMVSIYGALGYPYRVEYRDGFAGGPYTPVAGFVLEANPHNITNTAPAAGVFRSYRSAQTQMACFQGPPHRLGNDVELQLGGDTKSVLEIHDTSAVATNQAGWSRIATVTNTTGTVTCRDSAATNLPARFYKAVHILQLP